MLEDAHIALTSQEKNKIEIVDFGLNNLLEIGLQIITYINTERVCAKELVLFPHQTCPEHLHPTIGTQIGKEETFRCRKGLVYLYVEGPKTELIKAKKPKTTTTVFNEIILLEGMQYTIYPQTKHWFQAGPHGAIVSEFSTKSTDQYDIFTDKNLIR
ncbi:D-lyxose/D-mannose family sugar isomerase [Mycoplasmatota bacterium]|nr:D-lyxose/D-mannose family sugar isomerase [Mycoplasmatota bacterium]